MTAATWALVSATGALAVVAAWYSWETHRIVQRMDLEREAMIRPWLSFQIVPWQPTAIKLRIENLGAGPALNVHGKVSATWDTGMQQFSWSYPALASGRYEEFGFPAPHGATNQDRFQLHKLRKRVSDVEARLEYGSATGRTYTLEETIDLRQLTDDWAESKMMATGDHPERLGPRVASALEEIVRHIKRTSGGFG